ncbi:MAG: cupin domain-containing protein [Sphaerochaetaceae bacterium]|nr:cupin domain-containing protein [Sphaerochaetaceae bacterium]
MKTNKNQIWVKNDNIDKETACEGVDRKILAYSEDLMCVENYFKEGAIGAMHNHPHTQITYVVSGEFEFTIGDTLLKQDSIMHGCKCLKEGVLLDIFTPMRKDFVLEL